MAVSIHKNDIPEGLDLGSEIAVDTETMGLKFGRDRLCLVQLADSKGTVYLIQIDKNQKTAPNLAQIPFMFAMIIASPFFAHAYPGYCSFETKAKAQVTIFKILMAFFSTDLFLG